MPKDNYEERRQARIDRYKRLAVNAQTRATALCNESVSMASQTNGQPIITGRGSSTASDIRFRERAAEKMDKSVQQGDRAEHWAHKAVAAQKNRAISSDDPEAIQKLKEKLANLQQRHAWNIALNKYYRKNKTAVGYDGLTEETAKELVENRPIPSYHLQNENAEINRIQMRIMQLIAREVAEYEDYQFDGGEVVHNREENRVQILFDDKPSEEIRTRLKINGFRWSPYNSAWQVMLTPANGRLARNIFPSKTDE